MDCQVKYVGNTPPNADGPWWNPWTLDMLDPTTFRATAQVVSSLQHTFCSNFGHLPLFGVIFFWGRGGYHSVVSDFSTCHRHCHVLPDPQYTQRRGTREIRLNCGHSHQGCSWFLQADLFVLFPLPPMHFKSYVTPCRHTHLRGVRIRTPTDFQRRDPKWKLSKLFVT